MRKRKKGRKLSRKTGPRRALLRSLVSALILAEKIKTTKARAKEISGMTEKFITKAKKNNLASRRQLAGYFSPKLVKKLVTELGPRYQDKKGGYSRVIKLGPRKTDGAEMAIIELIN